MKLMICFKNIELLLTCMATYIHSSYRNIEIHCIFSAVLDQRRFNISAGGNAYPLFSKPGDLGFVRARIDENGFSVEFHGIDADSMLYRSESVGPRHRAKRINFLD